MIRLPVASPGRVVGAVYLIAAFAALFLSYFGPLGVDSIGLGDLPYLILLLAHYAWGAILVFSRDRYHRRSLRRFFFIPELLLSATLVVFIFVYLFALNANMDYVQRFIESGGNLRLALDTETERAVAWIRFSPFLIVNAAAFFLLRARRISPRIPGIKSVLHPARPWSLLPVLLSAVLSALAQPSAVSLDGFGWLGWFALVPLILVVERESPVRAITYGIVYGVFTTILTNYWLGTFSLVSLQVAVLIHLVQYAILFPILVYLLHRVKIGRTMLWPVAFTAFEYARSSGFLGYPWSLIAHSQYANLPVIQLASITGVWGVTFVVVLVNVALARLVTAVRRPGGLERFGFQYAVAAVIAVVVASGALVVAADDLNPETPDRTIRAALIQQNSDPRKHEYAHTFATLRRLTNESLQHNPDIVVWSETAFVPNIRRWSQEDPTRVYLARLVRDFLSYQKGIGTWLLTGNDDYEVIFDDDGSEIERLNYNAAVLFSETGERVETYHKIRLVPFTEHFPYEDSLPWIYNLLLEFDVSFWEEGTERTVFRHPKFAFSTPICFEDVFPDEVRRFVLEGAEVIVNISNDYWSLEEAQAKQHFVAGLFRAVENRRPLIRSTASGLTARVDRFGRVHERLPYFVEESLVVDVPIHAPRTTIYTRFGDWFPRAMLIVLALMYGASVPLVSNFLHRRPWRHRPRPRRSSRADGGVAGASREPSETDGD
ncbi:MAG: apolipoprotein N-acyltransferase [Spirochaetaceae bacterium]|nr:MAG: apolipoprotein N-acyltransferase [Spirochaetaceae bacterium]